VGCCIISPALKINSRIASPFLHITLKLRHGKEPLSQRAVSRPESFRRRVKTKIG
jgi:hypothetical protein